MDQLSFFNIGQSALCCRRPFPTAQNGRDSDPVSDEERFKIQKFKEKLLLQGVNVENFGGWTKGKHTKTLRDLFREVDNKEADIRMDSGKCVRHIERVRIYLLAEVGNLEKRETRCLIELERFDLRDGFQKTIHYPLGVKIRQGEEWRDAMRRVMEMEVGLDLQQQREYLDIDESSYHCFEEKYVSNSYPELRTVHTVHEVSVFAKTASIEAARMTKLAASLPKELAPRGSGASHTSSGARRSTMGVQSQSFYKLDDKEEENPLQHIGLPDGRDFVTKEVGTDGSLKLHVWCWRSREYVRNSKLQAFETYLASRGVDVSRFGTGLAKSMFQFYQEVRETQESSLQEVTIDQGSNGVGRVTLQRVVELVKLKLIAKIEKRRRILYSPSHVLADGRQRKVNQLIAGKMKKGEEWQKVVEQTLASQLGVAPWVQEECFKIDEERQEYVEEVKPSEGYAGLSTLYKTRTVTIHITDIMNPALERLGLPFGSDFITKEGELQMKKSGRLHVWTWQPAGAEEEREEEDSVFVDTAFGTLSKTLRDAEHLLDEMQRHPGIEQIGMGGPLTRALEKIRHCVDKFSNIDETLAEVKVNFKQDRTGKKGGDDNAATAEERQETSRIVDFITANFTRAAAPEPKKIETVPETPTTDRSSRKHSTWASVSSAAQAASKDLVEIQDGLDNWGLDLFGISQRNMYILESYGEVVLVPMCHAAIGCDRDTTRSFLKKVAGLYYNNPYHNAIHATQVCHSSGWLTRSVGLSDVQGGLETTAFMIAALCHDVKHFGRNNAFCMNTEHQLAVLYNDYRVLENMHTATTFELLQPSGSDEVSLLKDLNRADKASLRAQIIEYILATDMSEHFEIISKFRVKRDSPDFDATQNESDRRFVARMCIKAGDIGHSGLPWDLHEEWSRRVTREFWQQGDEERSLSIPLSALCDRHNVGDVGKSQKGFLEFVCAPLFEELGKFEVDQRDKEDDEDEESTHHEEERSRSSRGRTASVVSIEAQASSSISRFCMYYLKDNVKHWLMDGQAERTINALNELCPDPALASPEQTKISF